MKHALAGYAAMARQEYGQAEKAAISLRDTVNAFLAGPSPATLAAARRAWIASRDVYGRTEVFRFAGGPIDEDQRFYLESRGVRPEIAERLVVLGFFDEVLDQLPAGALAGELRERVAAKLDLGEVGS